MTLRWMIHKRNVSYEMRLHTGRVMRSQRDSKMKERGDLQSFIEPDETGIIVAKQIACSTEQLEEVKISYVAWQVNCKAKDFKNQAENQPCEGFFTTQKKTTKDHRKEKLT